MAEIPVEIKYVNSGGNKSYLCFTVTVPKDSNINPDELKKSVIQSLRMEFMGTTYDSSGRLVD